MGRIGAKGKKPSATNKDDSASSDKEKVRAQRKRGRPQKSPKDEIDEEDENSEDTTGVPNKDAKATNGRKLKRDAQVKENVDLVEEEIGNGKISSTEESKKSNGSRQNRNRRKNKPRRAAEAVVQCS